MTAQGHLHPRSIFNRAIERGNVVVAEATARELGRLSLEEALELVLLYATCEQGAGPCGSVHSDYPSVDEYVRRSSEMGGMFSRAWAEAREEEHERMKDDYAKRLHRSPSTAATSSRASHSAPSRAEPQDRRAFGADVATPANRPQVWSLD